MDNVDQPQQKNFTSSSLVNTLENFKERFVLSKKDQFTIVIPVQLRTFYLSDIIIDEEENESAIYFTAKVNKIKNTGEREQRLTSADSITISKGYFNLSEGEGWVIF